MRILFYIIIFLTFGKIQADEVKLKISLDLNIEGYPIYIDDISKKKNMVNFSLLKLAHPIMKKNFSSKDYKNNDQLFYIKMKYKF